jgi:hypothetical protein
MRLITTPDDKEYAAKYLHTAVQHELIELPASVVNTKLPQILMLLEQTKYRLLHPEDLSRTYTDYGNLVSRLYKYRMTNHSTPEERIVELRDGLLTSGTTLISNTVMKTCFISMYEIPGLSFTEGFAILLNQIPTQIDS